MLPANKITTVALGLVLCACLTFAGEAPEAQISEQVVTEENGIVSGDFEFNGRRVHYASYDPKLPKVSDARKAIDGKLMGDLSPLIVGITFDTMVKRKSSFTVGAHYGTKLIGILTKTVKKYGELEKTDKSANMSPEFVNEMINMLKGLMSDSKTAIPPALEPQQFVDSVSELLDILRATVDKSPVGLYIDFTHMTVDGERLQTLGSSYIAYFRKQGYGGVLKLMDTAVSFLANWMQKKTHKKA